MAVNTVDFLQNRTAVTDRGPSPAIWGDCPVTEFIENPGKGMYFFDDFTGPTGLITSPTTEAALVGTTWNGFGSSAATHTFSNELGGALVMTIITDNLAVYARSKSGFCQVSALLGTLWFEARVKIGSSLDDNMGFVLGLWDDVACSVVVPLSTANPPIFATTGNFVGFWAREEDAGAVGTTWKSDGNAGAGGLVVQSTVHTFVSDTYVKLGMKFDPKGFGRGLGPLLQFYVNNVVQSSYVVVPDNTGTGFPADVRMSPMVGHRMGATATSGVTTVDWVRVSQRFV